MEDYTQGVGRHKGGPTKEGLWKLSKWARGRARKPNEGHHLPALRRLPVDPYVEANAEKATILAERFFPPPAQADLSNIPEGGRGHTGPWPLSLYISSDITGAAIAEVIQS